MAERREGLGKGPARRSRRDGWIPGVMYGLGEESIAIRIPARELLELIRKTSGEKVLIDLKIGDESKLATIQDIQRHPVTGEVIHVDLLLLHKGKEVEIEIPITITGTAPGIKKGGILDVITHSLRVKALPKDLPPHIEIDISGLDVGGVVHVRDISLPGVHIMNPLDQPVVSILTPRVAIEKEEAPAEEAEGERPEGESPAKGETESKPK
ncbi:MAG: 50S ribosomal protein L25 [candidate division WOR-3 bacterium]